jgi:putative DNA primase/helicase
LGIPTKVLNGRHQPCPGCGGKDRFRYSNFNNNGGYFCSQCGPGTGIDLLGMVHGWDWKTSLDEIDKVIGGKRAYPTAVLPRIISVPSVEKGPDLATCLQLYAAGYPIVSNDPAGAYLRNRSLMGCDYRHLHKVLRYVPKLYHGPTKAVYPGIIAEFSNPDGKLASIHRSYLTMEGKRADIKPNRMFLSGRLPKGGAVRLSAPNEDLTRMGIAEGIETALSARALRRIPVWAATGEQILRQWMPPPEAQEITIFADNDVNGVGQAAARDLEYRLVRDAQHAGIDRRVFVEIPPQTGTDWNDVLKQGGLS